VATDGQINLYYQTIKCEANLLKVEQILARDVWLPELAILHAGNAPYLLASTAPVASTTDIKYSI